MDKLVIGISIVILLIMVIAAFFPFYTNEETDIKSAIKNANYCEFDSDCVDAGGKCPFGCYVYVNKNEVNQISELIETYDSKCIYDCVMCPTAVCENQTCKAVCIN